VTHCRLSLLGCDSISRWALAPVATCIGRGANAQTANVRDLAFYKITALACEISARTIQTKAIQGK